METHATASTRFALRPFRIHVPEEDLDELRRRVLATRWPDRETVTDDSQGVPLATIQQLARYWATEYDWRTCEARLNALPQFLTEIDGLDIHFIHVRSKHEHALPLIVTHGWPGSVIEHMRQWSTPEVLASFWNSRFPGQIPDHLVLADPLPNHTIDLEGHELVAVELGHTDTDKTTCLHVPAIGLVVTGDAAYNDVHLYLAESNAQTRREWIAALDTIESLHPRAVIAGHKRPGSDDDPRIIEETRQYIRDFDRVAETTKTARELYDQMLERYPARVNPGALWTSARALKP